MKLTVGGTVVAFKTGRPAPRSRPTIEKRGRTEFGGGYVHKKGICPQQTHYNASERGEEGVPHGKRSCEGGRAIGKEKFNAPRGQGRGFMVLGKRERGI